MAQNSKVGSSNQRIEFNLEISRKLASDLTFCTNAKLEDELIIANLTQESQKCGEVSDTYKNLNDGLTKDKVELKTRGDRFEKVYTTCTDDLNKSKQEKPSRLVWLAVGFATAVVLGTAVIYAIKK